MKRILAILFALCLILVVGCENQVKKVTPYSSSIDTSSEPTDDFGEVDDGDDIGNNDYNYNNTNTDKHKNSRVNSSTDNATDNSTDDGEDSNTNSSDNNSTAKDNGSTNSTVSSDKSNSSTNSSSKPKKYYEVSGGQDAYLTLLADDSEEVTTTVHVEKGTSVPTLKTKWRTMNFVPVESKIEDQATALRNEILNSGNTAEYYTWTGKTYYVSPDGDDANDGLSEKTAVKTMDADVFFMNPPQPGDAVLFERGGLWRLTSRIKVKKGVTYGSYGKGEKPTLYGSAHNYADEKYWFASRKANVWKVTVPDGRDIGLMVFNHGELVGRKTKNGITTLEENGDFYYNYNDDTVYVYFDKGNPGKYYSDIEIGNTICAFGGSADDFVIDNFKIKYFGQGGMYFSAGTHNTAITHCEIGFIGGYQEGTSRAGNCVQQWNNGANQYVAYNWMYQPYDTGYTFQGNDTFMPEVDDTGKALVDEDAYYNDITVEYNLFEYCNYAIEAWHSSRGADHDFPIVQIKNFKIQHNIMRFSGYGWGGMHRPAFTGYAFYVGKRNFKNAKNCLITDNIFDLASRSLVYWNFQGFNLGDWTITGNTFYQSENRRNEGLWYGGVRYAYNQSDLESAVGIFDSTPKQVVWVE